MVTNRNSLNPFFIRAIGSIVNVAWDLHQVLGLNPFFIRAIGSIKLGNYSVQGISLNPFFIRAIGSIKTVKLILRAKEIVLIPSSSGQSDQSLPPFFEIFPALCKPPCQF